MLHLKKYINSVPVIALTLVLFLCCRSTHKENCAIACKNPNSRKMLIAGLAGNVVTTDTGKDTAKMVLIKGGSFLMGSDDPQIHDAGPVHEVAVSDFYMDAHEVTNAQFAAFINATGYVTIAERPLDPKDYPDVPKELLVPSSAVFSPPSRQPASLHDPLQWWQYVKGANWKQPEGPGSSFADREHEPVTQVCYLDALAYAKWAGKRLPTEAEWEYAARAGGKSHYRYYWGDELKPAGKWVANIFQGNFPSGNTKEDGFSGTAPVASFPANAVGLYDMEGNVWEWCADYYRPGYPASATVRKDPIGPADSYDPDEPGSVKRVQRGGSFLCSDQYCIRYIAGSRGKGEESSASNNLGFRCVKDAQQ